MANSTSTTTARQHGRRSTFVRPRSMDWTHLTAPAYSARLLVIVAVSSSVGTSAFLLALSAIVR